MGFWDFVEKAATIIIKQMLKYRCPSCSSSSFKYGYSFVQEYGLSNFFYLGYSLASNSIAGVIDASSTFLSGLFSNNQVPLNPLLICNECKTYFIICPNCNSSQALPRYAKSGEIYKCGNCDKHFGSCSRNDEFDNLVNNDWT